MDIVWMVIIGLLAGVLAKAIMPGERGEPKGCLMTTLLGIGGSLLVGLLMKVFFASDGRGGFLPTLTGATIGAILLIAIFRKFWTSERKA
ncbi:MAG TPA: GlsB/YeaQ/YmgE family stress response membrane protein [Fimbriimonadaceae bacterium]|nr:GlsB/YeaQ/YmgE family stress response membrane protein [Fimbriimonadaceae bacterium]